jgi:hypothetical protein
MARQLTFFDNVENSTRFPLLDDYFATLKAPLSHCSDHNVHLFSIKSFEHERLLQTTFNPK